MSKTQWPISQSQNYTKIRKSTDHVQNLMIVKVVMRHRHAKFETIPSMYFQDNAQKPFWDVSIEGQTDEQHEDIMPPQIARFMGPTWGPLGSCRPQVGPMLAP